MSARAYRETVTDLRAEAALLLSHWWSRPTAIEREIWAQSFVAAEDIAVDIGCELDPVRELADTLALSGTEAMLDEYERLFVGPGAPPCQPYESLWLGGPRRRDAGSVMGPAATAVSSIYDGLGLNLEDDAHELPDHVMIEWEALGFALYRGASDACDKLLGDHLAEWMPPFCQAVSETATVPFYVRLATLTPAWTAALGQ